MQTPTLQSLEQLPEFNRYPFNGKSDVPVFEVARITQKTTPQTTPPYNLQNFRYIVGRSPDLRTIYYSSDVMVRKDGSVMAIHGDCAGQLMADTVESYEVVVPNSKLVEMIGERRI